MCEKIMPRSRAALIADLEAFTQREMWADARRICDTLIAYDDRKEGE